MGVFEGMFVCLRIELVCGVVVDVVFVLLFLGEE